MSKANVPDKIELPEWRIGPSILVEKAIDLLEQELNEFGIVIDKTSDSIFVITEGDMLCYFIPSEAVIKCDESFSEALDVIFEARLVMSLYCPIWFMGTHAVH